MTCWLCAFQMQYSLKARNEPQHTALLFTFTRVSWGKSSAFKCTALSPAKQRRTRADGGVWPNSSVICIGAASPWRAQNINLWLRVWWELSPAEARSGPIKQSWRGNDSAPNQIYSRSPRREIDVLSQTEDFNSLCYDTDKQSALCLESISLIVWRCARRFLRICLCALCLIYFSPNTMVLLE